MTFAGNEFTASGLVGGDSVASVTLTSAGATAGAGVGGSPYVITPGAATGTGLSNYDIAYGTGALTVNRARYWPAAGAVKVPLGVLLVPTLVHVPPTLRWKVQAWV